MTTMEASTRAIVSWSGGGAGLGVLVHGGAGEVPRERRPLQQRGCMAAAHAAWGVLKDGGSALDAVQRAVQVLEDDPHFNAGTGASLTADGKLELDAAPMEGRELKAGAVCALGPFKNPIAIARAVLEENRHVLYAATGADSFARQAGFEPVDESSMITQSARDKLRRALLDGRPACYSGGTVGAVARDRRGSVAAATSTGGIAGKRSGRVGDSPVLGAGTYADDRSGAGSATGYGEGILRVALTARALEAMRLGAGPEHAAREGIKILLQRVSTLGGLILVDSRGRVGWARSTQAMSWAAAWDGAELVGGC
jgi:L-asparaginase / beta-aspartyl-peptidase